MARIAKLLRIVRLLWMAPVALSFALLCVVATVQAHAQDSPSSQAAPALRVASAVFIDRSGSMKPYYESGLIDSIVQPIQRQASSNGQLSEFAFSTEPTRVRSLHDLEALSYGNFTYLDKVIDECERDRTPIAWIVTDNIEDTGEAGNTERFYAKLHGTEVLRVTVFPVLAQAGHPGLIVYALLFNAAASDAYDNALAAFRAGAQGVIHTNPLRMKPVDRDTVEVTSRNATPLTRRGNERVYETGVPVKETIEVRFKSKFDHLEIVDSNLRVLDAAPEFQTGSVLYPEHREIAIDPSRIRSLGPGSETAQLYLLTLDLGRLQLKRNPAALWKAAWSKPVEQEQLDLAFEIDVPGKNFQLSPGFLHEYSASTLSEAKATGKVYAIDQLLSHVNGDYTRIRVDSPLFFKVRYPTWPAVLWLVLFAIALALLIGLLLLGRKLVPTRRRLWEVTAEAPGGYTLAAKIEAGRVIVENETVGTIEKNHLVPTGTTQLEKGALRIPLVNGIRVPVRTRRSEMDLIFNEATGIEATGQPPQPGPPASPRRPGAASPISATAASPHRSPGRPAANPTAPPRRR